MPDTLFNVNDKVVVIGGNHIGKSGMVSHIIPYTLNQSPVVVVRIDNNVEICCRTADLERQPEAAQPKAAHKCATCNRARLIIQIWLDKQSHDKCHYYPELFNALAELFGLGPPAAVGISREEFAQGCLHYQDELYGAE